MHYLDHHNNNDTRYALLRRSEEPPIDPNDGLGIFWIWQLPDTHPFHDHGIWHDKQYDARRSGLLEDESSARVDKEFYWLCMGTACKERSLWLRAEAELFYQLTRGWGILGWPSPTQNPVKLYGYERRRQKDCRKKTKKIPSKSQKTRASRRA